MLSRIVRPFCLLTLALTTALAAAGPPDAPPPPEAPLPPVPACQAVGRCRLSSSDDFAADASPELLPGCSSTHLPPSVTFEAIPAAPDSEVCRPAPVIGAASGLGREYHQIRQYTKAVRQALTAKLQTRELGKPTPTLAVGAQGCCTISASTPSGHPDTLTPIEHLNIAAEHLEAAGLPKEAAQVRQQALAMRHQMQRRLEELRELRQRVQREIEELERVTKTAEQIEVKVSLIEVDEAKLRNLGFNFLTFDSHNSTKTVSADQLKGLLDGLRAEGLAKVIAEPTLVTRDGQEATIFSGGQFPILIPQPNGDIKVEHRECGVRLTATPHLLGDGRIRLHLAPQYSVRDFDNAREINGIKVPGITARRVNTEVEMQLGETIVLGGLRSIPRESVTVGQLKLVDPVGQLKLTVGNMIEQACGGGYFVLSSGRQQSGQSFIVVATPRLVAAHHGHPLPTAQASPKAVGRSHPQVQPTSFIRNAPEPADQCQLASGDVLGVFIETILGEAGEEPPVHLSKDAGGEQALGFPVQIAEDGTIALPRIEPIQAAGLTLAELRNVVKRAYTIDRQLLKSDHHRIIVTLLKRHAQ